MSTVMMAGSERKSLCLRRVLSRHLLTKYWIAWMPRDAKGACACACGGRTTDAKGWLKRGEGSRALVGFGGEVDMRGRGTPDIPRFGALRRDNTPSPAEFSWMVDSTMSLLKLFGGGRRLAKAPAAPSPWCCYVVASPILLALSCVALHAVCVVCLC